MSSQIGSLGRSKWPSVKGVVEDTDTRAGRAFNLSIQVLIVLSIVSFSVETLPDLSPGLQAVLTAVEAATVAIFTVEYLLRLLVADNRFGYVFSFYGLVDLLAILPFYLSTALDLRALRVLRMLRLFRILKLARYTTALERFRQAFLRVRHELVVFFAATCMVLYVAALGIYTFEREAQPQQFASVFHALWWALTTLTTVGYGDVYPVTAGGRVFAAVVMLVGIGIVAVPSGLMASALTASKAEEAGGTGADEKEGTGPFC
ncbi:MAG: ion transporter [Planctomycetes bacterium]|nr:ion transporter [Planctomycetota bacterium]